MKIVSVLACAAATFVAGSAAADFSGYYAPENWDFFAEYDGYLVDDSPGSVTIWGTNESEEDEESYTRFLIEAQGSGYFEFDWTYGTEDEPGYDEGGYVIGDEYFVLDDGDGPGEGNVSIFVEAGTTIGFYVWSEDNCCGAGFLTVSNFTGPVPAPGATALLGLAALGRRRRR